MSAAPTVATVADAGAILADEARRFAGYGWMRGTSGNLSLVLDRDPLTLAVTASGLDKSELSTTDVVVIDAAGAAVDPAETRSPSAEAGLHAHIASRTGAGAIFHVHAMDAVIAGARWPGGVELRDLEMLKGIGHHAHDEKVLIPVIENHQDMAVEAARFDAVYTPATAEVPEVPVLIVAGHGMYAWGATHLDARRHLEIAEWLLRFTVATR